MSDDGADHVLADSNDSEKFAPLPKYDLPSPISPPLGSGQSSCFSFDAGSSLYGGLGVARESRAQWSFVEHDSTSKNQSPLERLGFKLHLGDKKTRDGQAPKRRGPKPDSKPALTRRQELNRQAQRTHRERKELYIKALEQEILRLKELFQQSARDREQVNEENRILKELLQAHGIQYDLPANPNAHFGSLASSYGGSTTSGATSFQQHSKSTGVASPTGTTPSSAPNRSALASPTNTALMQQTAAHYQPVRQQGLDYDQVGVDFVLQLEQPCQEHMQMLLVRSDDSDGEISGHVLMASCPPQSHLQNKPDQPYGLRTFSLPGSELRKLLDLSAQLPLVEYEIPPIKAWAMVRSHPRFEELTQQECSALRDDLAPKIKCYGFGAVLQDFEVRDALANIFTKKGDVLEAEVSQMAMEWDPQPRLQG